VLTALEGICKKIIAENGGLHVFFKISKRFEKRVDMLLLIYHMFSNFCISSGMYGTYVKLIWLKCKVCVERIVYTKKSCVAPLKDIAANIFIGKENMEDPLALRMLVDIKLLMDPS
jgi:hypothetical protein